jgi:hypothetical protein
MPISFALAKGLDPEEALARWSDPDAFAKMKELEDARDTIVNTPEGQKRHWDYVKYRDEAESGFMELVYPGRVLVSAVAEGQDKRLIIPLSIWPLLCIDFECALVLGETRQYELPEFFEPSAIPANVDEIPDWVKTLPDYEAPDNTTPGDLSSSIPIVFAVEGRQVLFNGGITPTADRARLLLALLEPFTQALHEDRDPEAFPFVEASKLAGALGIAEQSIRQLVYRTRLQLSEEFVGRFRIRLHRNAIIENNRSDGYRLNPRIIVAKPFQVIHLH